MVVTLCFVSIDIIAVTDVSPDQNSLHVVFINTREVYDGLTDRIGPFAVCMMDALLVVTDKLIHSIYRYDWSSKELKLLVGKIGEKGFMNGPYATSTLTSPVVVAIRGSTLYIAESRAEHQGPIRVFSNLEGLMTFKSIWYSIGYCFGMVSKLEKNYIVKKDPPLDFPTSLNIADISKKLPERSNKLYDLIDKNRQIHSNKKLDITHGSMAS